MEEVATADNRGILRDDSTSRLLNNWLLEMSSASGIRSGDVHADGKDNVGVLLVVAPAEHIEAALLAVLLRASTMTLF